MKQIENQQQDNKVLLIISLKTIRLKMKIKEKFSDQIKNNAQFILFSGNNFKFESTVKLNVKIWGKIYHDNIIIRKLEQLC